MGDYSNVKILYAESDFDPEEREFMARLRERFFGREMEILARPDGFWDREKFRERVHADLGLPGTADDWRYLRAEEIGGRLYYRTIDSLRPGLIPPFPRRFGAVTQYREKYGIRPMWYALFAAGDLDGRYDHFQAPVAKASRQFKHNLEGIWQFLFSGFDDDRWAALLDAAPAGSEARKCIRRVFERLPFVDYLRILHLLADDLGGHALIELDFYEVSFSFGDHDENRASIQAEFESTLRVLDALRRGDVASLPGEVFFATDRRYDGAGVEPWLAAYEDLDGIRRFRHWFLPDPGWFD
jgi:hypothetical protein